MANPVIGDPVPAPPAWRSPYSSTVVAIVALMCWSGRLPGQTLEQPVTPQSVKAAYLLRFADYVTWPDGVLDDPAAPLTVGVVGDDAVAHELRELTAGRKVLGRSVVVRELDVDQSMAGVHILFVPASRTRDLPRLREAGRARSTLVVSESRNALQLGSVINFRPVGRRIRFEASLDAAEEHGLTLSSKLLSVAERVEPRSD